jgi:DNA-binding response OmpR family regulator
VNILIADDDPDITQGLQFLLGKRGHQVAIASDGDAALALAAAMHPDVIFLDVNMPGKTGFQVCEILRAQPRFRDLPIYMLTGQDHDLAYEAGRVTGATDYLIKPFTPSRLLEILALLPPRPSSANK